MAGARPSRRRGRRLLLAALAAVAVVAAVFYGGGGWYFAGVLDNLELDGAARRDATAHPSYDISVLAVDPAGSDHRTIRLSVPKDAPEVLEPGTWGLAAADGGYGQASAIDERGSGWVTRDFVQLEGPQIHVGERLNLDYKAFPGDPQLGLGLEYQNVSVAGPLGGYPAWFIPGSGTVWTVMVHGNSMLRQDMLRLSLPVHAAGLPILIISYRNDPGAPADPSGKLRYGAAEWPDLQAAVRYALDHGATRVVLAGVSMGGGIVVAFLEHSDLAADVNAVILDSPMLDFQATVEYGAGQRTILGMPLPDSLTTVARWIAALRFGVPWGDTHYLADDAALRVPMLVFHGTADTLVPISLSRQLARDRPDLVTLVVTEGARHVGSWNTDPGRYEAAVAGFLAAHAAG